MKPLSSHGKGKMPELQSTREESSDDDKSDHFARESRANLKGRWDAPVHKETSFSKKMMLDWSSFEWKPHHSEYLTGNENWSSYKAAILLQLECIG